MEFNNLNQKMNNFNKPEWQECDNVHVVSCVPAQSPFSAKGKNYYYHKVECIDANGNSVPAQFVTDSPSAIAAGEYSVECQVKMFNGKKTFTLRLAHQSSQANQNNTQVYSNKSPEESIRIARGNAANAASRVATDPATFWGLVNDIYEFIYNGNMPI